LRQVSLDDTAHDYKLPTMEGEIDADMAESHWGRMLASYYPNFVDPYAFSNKPAPSPMVAFITGGVLLVINIVLWLIRVKKLKERTGDSFRGEVMIRGMIACAKDNDEPYYTMCSFSAVSLIFLGGIQIDFKTSFLAMLCYIFVASLGSLLRVVLAFCGNKSLSDMIIVSDEMEDSKDQYTKIKEKQFQYMEVQPSNVYQDIGRQKTLVWMIFITQVTFMAFVCITVYQGDTHKCLDGTLDCPVAMTASSYIFYIVGIFQACLYLLGPKTNYGQSEMSQSFWTVLFLAAKQNGARVLWDDPVHEAKYSEMSTMHRDTNGKWILDEDGNPKLFRYIELYRRNFHTWARFVMSYLVNGIGFNILILTLPIQVAQQSTLIGVVFRAVGMMYIADLDDSKGLKLIIVENESGEHVEMSENTNRPQDRNVEQSAREEKTSSHDDNEALSAEANAIIQEARQKLEDLAKNGPTKRPSTKRPCLGSKSISGNSFGCIPTDGGGRKKTEAAAILAAATENADVSDVKGEGSAFVLM